MSAPLERLTRRVGGVGGVGAPGSWLPEPWGGAKTLPTLTPFPPAS